MTPDTEALDRVEKARACEAALKSQTFARSDQLQGFLPYICELELLGRGHEIAEYSIATEALNRPSDYAPGEDSSVRSRAHSLRRKLQEYYKNEAPDSECSLVKHAQILEGLRLEARIDALNVINQVSFGAVTTQRNVPRRLQFVLRLQF